MGDENYISLAPVVLKAFIGGDLSDIFDIQQR
jgi:hypothetical protein